MSIAQQYVESCPELAEGVPLYFRTKINTDLLKAPRYVQIVLTPKLLGKLERNRRLCVEHDLAAVQAYCDPETVDDGSDVAWVGVWYLMTDGVGFWLRGDADSAGAVASDTVEFISLVQALRARPPSVSGAQLPESLSWFGGALLCDAEGLGALREAVEASYPALAARQTELDMATAISAVAEAAPSSPDDAAPRRRPSL